MSSRYISDALRKVVAARAQNRCEYCRCSADVTTETFSVEHSYPYSLGGGNTLENLAWSCMGCNGFKGARIQAIDPLTNLSGIPFPIEPALATGIILYIAHIGIDVFCKCSVPQSIDK